MSKQTTTTTTTTTTTQPKRDSDGRFAAELATATAVQRQMRRDAEREARRLELIAEYGDDWVMYA